MHRGAQQKKNFLLLRLILPTAGCSYLVCSFHGSIRTHDEGGFFSPSCGVYLAMMMINSRSRGRPKAPRALPTGLDAFGRTAELHNRPINKERGPNIKLTSFLKCCLWLFAFNGCIFPRRVVLGWLSWLFPSLHLSLEGTLFLVFFHGFAWERAHDHSSRCFSVFSLFTLHIRHFGSRWAVYAFFFKSDQRFQFVNRRNSCSPKHPMKQSRLFLFPLPKSPKQSTLWNSVFFRLVWNATHTNTTFRFLAHSLRTWRLKNTPYPDWTFFIGSGKRFRLSPNGTKTS